MIDLSNFDPNSAGNPNNNVFGLPLSEEDARLARALQELDDAFQFILSCNRPTVLAQGGFEQLQTLASLSFRDARGEKRQLLTPKEVQTLSIPKGSLSREERLVVSLVSRPCLLTVAPYLSIDLPCVPDPSSLGGYTAGAGAL